MATKYVVSAERHMQIGGAQYQFVAQICFFCVCMFSAITLFAITIFIALLRQYGLVWIVYMCVIRVFMVPTYGIVVTVQNMHVPLNSLCDLHCAMHS